MARLATAAETADDLSQYLYLKEPPEQVYPVQEFKDSSKPDFLYNSEYPYPRIVEFYAHWCGHCQHFKPKFIEFAKSLYATTTAWFGETVVVQVHAISCVPHQTICNDFKIHGFPSLRLFPAYSLNGTDLPQGKLSPTHVLRQLGMVKPDSKKNSHQRNPTMKADAVAAGGGFQTVGPPPHFLPRTVKETWDDAHLSLDFLLRNGVFLSNGPLDASASDALIQFLDICRRALAPSSSLSPLVQGLWKLQSTITHSDADLIQVLDNFPDASPPSQTWSPACLQHGTGYTCGLWTLFHCVTVGTVEWNLQNGENPQLLLATMQVADAIRNFIEHFFQCDECRAHFIKEYDSCGYDRCNRLSFDQSSGSTKSLGDWKQLVLWLYETHNGVNVRLRGERIAIHEHEDTTDEWQVQWPAVDQCPMCWLSHGRWDEDRVYRFLRMQYWPDEPSSELMIHHPHMAPPRDEDLHPDVLSAMNKFRGPNTNTSLEPPTDFSLPLLGIVLISIVSGYIYRRKRLYKLKGYHKKIESYDEC
jgi:thiol oxidase